MDDNFKTILKDLIGFVLIVVFVLALVLMLLFTVRYAFAEQLDYSTTQDAWYFNTVQNIGTGITEINDLEIKIAGRLIDGGSGNYQSDTITLEIRQCDNNSSPACTNPSSKYSSTKTFEEWGWVSNNQDIQTGLIHPNLTGLNGSKYHQLLFTSNISGVGSRNIKFAGTTSGSQQVSNSTTAEWVNSNIKNIYWKTELVPPPVNSLKITYPVNSTSSVPPDFDNWGNLFQVSATTTDPLSIAVYYGTFDIDPDTCESSTSTPCYVDEDLFFSVPPSYPPYKAPSIEYEQTIQHNHQLLFSELYSAKAILYKWVNGFRSTVATSTQISFETGNTLQAETPYIPPTSTSTDLNITCDPESGFFQYSFCYVLSYLFIPSNNSVDRFSTLTPTIENKPPLGYFYSVKNAITNLSTTTAPISLNLGDTSLSSSPFYIFKTGLNWILWFVFAFWVLNRFRHIEL